MMRAWGTDGIEMEGGHDFITIVCSCLRKIATEGAGIGGGVFMLEISLLYPFFFYYFFIIFFLSIYSLRTKGGGKKGRKKKKAICFATGKVKPAPTGRIFKLRDLGCVSVRIENLLPLIPSNLYGDKGYAFRFLWTHREYFANAYQEIPYSE